MFKIKAEFSMPRSSKRYEFEYTSADDFQTVITQFNVDHSQLNGDNLLLKSMNGYDYHNKKVSYLYFQKVLNKVVLNKTLNSEIDRLLVLPITLTDRQLKNIGKVEDKLIIENHLVVIFDKLENTKQVKTQAQDKPLSYKQLSEQYQSLINSRSHVQQMLMTHVDNIQMCEIAIDNDEALRNELLSYVPNFNEFNTTQRFSLLQQILQLSYQTNSWVQVITNRDLNKLMKLIKIVVDK